MIMGTFIEPESSVLSTFNWASKHLNESDSCFDFSYHPKDQDRLKLFVNDRCFAFTYDDRSKRWCDDWYQLEPETSFEEVKSGKVELL
ncbi:hypothetical protein DXV75_01195 [Alteromonas aestuariivivens]|uniref:Uncharacterized protein n=1 Tax=Alteromonas aestuariivivens TaxID=1938339 RepID=A0A3D8MFW6_9ALTE|nr:hypothetical protein DXV75_01195 [Alteromonas aestuariivivens]